MAWRAGRKKIATPTFWFFLLEKHQNVIRILSLASNSYYAPHYHGSLRSDLATSFLAPVAQETRSPPLATRLGRRVPRCGLQIPT